MSKERLLTEEIRTTARSMITCSHANMLDDEEFDKYLSEILAKTAEIVKGDAEGSGGVAQ
ncbi:hypothetical protein LCGC14_1580310 [marine sediment metagenome]|uniref:Uncharacterized protein n=1 Tax=marine sediment metagenome TaxID=412755 RepID=A0A0F9LH84_9ZZZZ